MVEAPPGFVLIGADFSQLEARIAAWLFQDTVDLEAFARGEDIHALTAMSAFGYSSEQWVVLDPKIQKQCRDWAKTFRYGVLLYGGEPETAKTKTFCPCSTFGCNEKSADTLSLSRDDMRTRTDQWFRRHPAVTRWREAALKQVRQHHHMVSPFGYPMYFVVPWGERDLVPQVFNRPIQHSAACIMNRAQVKLDALGCPIILQHHDAFYALSPVNEATHWAELMRTTMEQPVPELGGLSFPVDLSAGLNWGDLADWHDYRAGRAAQANGVG
jgi:DNA polymerase-1